MRKEIMVTGDSEVAALVKLEREFAEYIVRKDIKGWRWLVTPEAKMRRPGQWRAYGRIEFDKG